VVARGAIAENYLKAKQYADAANEYKQLLALTPANLPALTNRGYALYHIKDYDEAEKVYRDLIKRDPKNAFAYNNLGAVLEAQNKRAEALTMYRKALQLKADYTEAKSNIDRITAMTAIG
jgi:tetratricopeptide (TPR) repeat protein